MTDDNYSRASRSVLVSATSWTAAETPTSASESDTDRLYTTHQLQRTPVSLQNQAKSSDKMYLFATIFIIHILTVTFDTAMLRLLFSVALQWFVVGPLLL